MPTTYLPAVTEYGVLIIPIAGKPDTYKRITWKGDTLIETGTICMAGKAESLIDVWERHHLFNADRRAHWEFHHGQMNTVLMSRAVASPSYITRGERIDLLLSLIFEASCSAREREDDARVQLLDARYAKVNEYWTHPA